jgi:hypothetical protein
VTLVQTKLACGCKDKGIKEKPEGAAAKEGKSCRWEVLFSIMQINSTIMGCFKNGAAFSQLKKKTM